MNIVGHGFVAREVIGRMNGKVALGADLPDLVPFIAGSAFSFEEIHEGGDRFYKFLEENNQEYLDVARGMMSHCVKFGADKFNKDIDKWLLKDIEEAEYWKKRIVEASEVDMETADHRLHNYLWAGVDVWVLKNKPRFVEEWARERKDMDEEMVAELLSECFSKDVDLVRQNLVDLEKAWQKNEWNVRGLVEGWIKFVSGLPEGDKVDVEKAVSLVEDIYEAFEGEWERVVKRVVDDVRERMGSYL